MIATLYTSLSEDHMRVYITAVPSVLHNGSLFENDICQQPKCDLTEIEKFEIKVGKESTKCSEKFRLKTSTQKPDRQMHHYCNKYGSLIRGFWQIPLSVGIYHVISQNQLSYFT